AAESIAARRMTRPFTRPLLNRCATSVADSADTGSNSGVIGFSFRFLPTDRFHKTIERPPAGLGEESRHGLWGTHVRRPNPFFRIGTAQIAAGPTRRRWHSTGSHSANTAQT